MFPFNLFGILCIFILFAFMVSRFWCCFVTLFSATTSCCLDNSFFLSRENAHSQSCWVSTSRKKVFNFDTLEESRRLHNTQTKQTTIQWRKKFHPLRLLQKMTVHRTLLAAISTHFSSCFVVYSFFHIFFL